jgi:L-threonylcarbamoyladenylate synthase
MSDNIEEAARIIKAGGLVAFPTETVYGLGANALDPIAVAKIFALKERPSFDPLIVHIASFDDMAIVTDEPTDAARKLAEKFWPGPLTIVLPKSSLIPDLVSSGLPTVAVRMPGNEIALRLIAASGCPLAAPSANKFGNLSPVCAKHVLKQLPGVDYILDGGYTTVGIESTIVSIEADVCTLLRPGKISLEDIEQALPGLFQFRLYSGSSVLVPGALKSHYSPNKPLMLLDRKLDKLPPRSGLIAHSIDVKLPSADKLLYTSQRADLLEIAASLFSSLHAMEDSPEIDKIYIDVVAPHGLGLAIMDRINKAVYKYLPNNESSCDY